MKFIKVTDDYYVKPEHVECVRVDDDKPIAYVSFIDGTEIDLTEFKTRNEARKFVTELVDKLNAEETHHVET